MIDIIGQIAESIMVTRQRGHKIDRVEIRPIEFDLLQLQADAVSNPKFRDPGWYISICGARIV